jgi:hypothetical protein
MDSGLRRVGLAAILALLPCAVHAGFEPGPRPVRAVFDPHGALDAAECEEISNTLEKIFKDEKVQVIAVVLENAEVSDPDALVTAMSEKWCGSSAHAIALHVPCRDGSPWIAAGGDIIHAINPDEVRDELAAVRRDAAREPDDVSMVRTAAHVTADMLRYWKGRELARRAVIENERALIRLELDARSRRQQIIMLTLAAAAIPLAAGVVLAIRLLGKNRRVPAISP